MRRRAARVAAALGCCLLIAGCSRSLPADNVEQELERQLSTQDFVPDVSCPEDLSGEVGATIVCRSTLADGIAIDITVMATEVDGDQVRYEFEVAPQDPDDLDDLDTNQPGPVSPAPGEPSADSSP